VTHGLGSNTFQLYVHRTGGIFIGLCTELQEVVEGASADEIIVKTEALIDSVAHARGTQKPRISVRAGPNLRKTLRSGG
jgi:hypothetical protein